MKEKPSLHIRVLFPLLFSSVFFSSSSVSLYLSLFFAFFVFFIVWSSLLPYATLFDWNPLWGNSHIAGTPLMSWKGPITMVSLPSPPYTQLFDHVWGYKYLKVDWVHGQLAGMVNSRTLSDGQIYGVVNGVSFHILNISSFSFMSERRRGRSLVSQLARDWLITCSSDARGGACLVIYHALKGSYLYKIALSLRKDTCHVYLHKRSYQMYVYHLD